jgi:hypothetical protein
MDALPIRLSTSPPPQGAQEETDVMNPTAVPARITIDFRDAVLPSRTWILGVEEAVPARVELLAPATPGRAEPAIPHRATSWRNRPTPLVRPTAILADCACPEFCERDHANE